MCDFALSKTTVYSMVTNCPFRILVQRVVLFPCRFFRNSICAQATRQYAGAQLKWFRNKEPDFAWVKVAMDRQAIDREGGGRFSEISKQGHLQFR